MAGKGKGSGKSGKGSMFDFRPPGDKADAVKSFQGKGPVRRSKATKKK